MLNLNPWTILFTVINILVLYLAFKRFLFQPVMRVIGQREELIKNQLEYARKEKEEAEQLQLQYQAQIGDAKSEAKQILTSAQIRAQEEYQKRMIQAKEDADLMLEKALSKIEQEQKNATEEAKSQIAGLALEVARKIMKTGDIHDSVLGK